MLGFVVGAAAGGFQFWLLSKFTARVTQGSFGSLDINTVLLGLFQFFLPAGVLVVMAFVRRADLIWTAVGITAVLILGSFGKFLIKMQGAGKRGGDVKK